MSLSLFVVINGVLLNSEKLTPMQNSVLRAVEAQAMVDVCCKFWKRKSVCFTDCMS